MTHVVVKEARPFIRWALPIVKRGLAGRTEIARYCRKIGQIVEISLQTECYRQTHTDSQADAEFKRRQEIVEDWAITFSGDLRWSLDRALDHAGHYLPFLLQGQIIEPNTERKMWRPFIDDEDKPTGPAPVATDDNLIQMGARL